MRSNGANVRRSGYRPHRALGQAAKAAAATLGLGYDRKFPVAGGFQGEQPFGAGGHTTTAAGAARRIDLERNRWVGHGRNLLKGEFELLPGAALDLGTGVVAGAGGDYRRLRLLAGPAAGEAEFVGFWLLFHGWSPAGAQHAAPLLHSRQFS